MKSRIHRELVFAASVVLLLAFAGPLWSYSFQAPQYPEGLQLRIYVNKLGGRVDLINELNHYVGMEKINESSFPELRMMPWIIGAMCALGLLVGAIGRRWAILGWLGAFAVLGLIGLYDFYSWLYLYGHNLNPRAPIRIPPFTPHLLGSYQLMNFHISSYPGLGGMMLMLSFVIGAVALLFPSKSQPRPSPGMVNRLAAARRSQVRPVPLAR
jgi:copper chaperone NosL